MEQEVKFYSLSFPEEVDFTPSMLVERIAQGERPFQLMMERRGLSPVEFIVASSHAIDDLLSFSVASSGHSSSVARLDVLKSGGYTTGLSLRRPDYAGTPGIAECLHASFLALRDHEMLRATLHIEPVGRLRRVEPGRMIVKMALTLLFSGSSQRLSGIFPLVLDRKYWKTKRSWQTRHRFYRLPSSAVDRLLPSFNDIAERKTGAQGRHIPLMEGSVMIEGLSLTGPGDGLPFNVEDSFFDKHVVVFGGTGTGKTTLLSRLVAESIHRGRSVCLIDPHGDLALRSLGALNPSYDERVLYVDPVECALGLNPFEVFRQSGKEEETSSLLSDSIGHVVKTAYGSEYWGPRMAYLLTGLLKSVATRTGTNFADIMELMNNPFAARELIDDTTDDATRNFLLSELPKARDEWWMSIKDKLGAIVLNESARTVLCRRNGNLDVRRAILDGKSIFADLSIQRIGRESSVLIGAILMSLFWIVAAGLGRKVTLVLDEAQLFPQDIVQEIASQGRKYGMNIVIASQSPSFYSREMLSTMASNFENIFALRLGKADAELVSGFFGGRYGAEIERLDTLSAIARTGDGVALIAIEQVDDGKERRGRLIEALKKSYGTEDDSLPSPMTSFEGQLFDVLQLVRLAEVQGKKSLSGIEETGAPAMLGYGQTELSSLIEKARSMAFVQKAHMKLTPRGRSEMFRLQGGMLAGDETHRSIVLALKDICDSMHLMTYIPRQRPGIEQPDMIAKMPGGVMAGLLYFEVEISTANRLDERRKKTERALKNNAIPVFVFEDPAPALSALAGTDAQTSSFLLFRDGILNSMKDGKWVEVNSWADITSGGIMNGEGR